jgi:alpha-L-rhamnosidase
MMIAESIGKIIRAPILVLLICCFSLFSSAQSPCVAVDLQCEYLVDPLGIDAARPRLSWRLQDSRNGAQQTAYQLYVGTDSNMVINKHANYWQTSKITSDKQLALCGGKELQPFTRYFWAVQVWDKNGRANLSRVASFETGMLNSSNWQGSWISDTRDIHLKSVPYFRKAFNTSKKIRRARAYVAVGGLYELYINGRKTGNHRLDPMYTRFDRRTLYVTHDITDQLKTGKNAIGVLLGNGWYNHQSTAVWYFHEAPWRNRPAFCMDIRITYEDGTTETITTGKDWKTALSPIIFNSIYTAEHHDARRQLPGWNEAFFNDSAWKNVIYRSAPSTNIVSQSLHPIRNVEKIQAVSMRKFSDTSYVFDIGRNISGVSSIKVSGPAGTTIRLKHGERLYPNGKVDISNIDAHYRPTDNADPFQTDIYILNGSGEEHFMPLFNYKGFQYVEFTSTSPLTLTKENLTGYFMHSDVPVVGNFNASNSTINKIWKATNSSYLSNLFGYPTDCPQREKNGWTGDAQIAIETGLYNFDGITIYEKWMADHRDEQQTNGVLPSIIPTGGWGYEWGNGPDWTSTIAIIPWNIYLFYGDSKLLADCYDNISRYVDHIDELYPDGLTSWGLGDWIPVKSKSSVQLTSTAYYYADAKILANAAKLFGKSEDHRKYSALAEKIKAAFNRRFLDKTKAIYGSGVQTELSVPLFWGLVPDEFKTRVADNLAKRVQADSSRLDVGLLGTKAILSALSDNGHADLAYKLAAQETYPSWGWWIVNGATTLYENWPIDAKSDISMNHIMFGEIGAWFYKALGGIKPDETSPGFKSVRLEPHFVPGLDSCQVSHKSRYGTIGSSWKRSNDRVMYNVTIPPNTSATVLLTDPGIKKISVDGKPLQKINGEFSFKLPAGTYRIECK